MSFRYNTNIMLDAATKNQTASTSQSQAGGVEHRDRCDNCDGTGVIECTEGDPTVGLHHFRDDCSHCDGTGLLESDSDDRSCDPEHYLEDEQ